MTLVEGKTCRCGKYFFTFYSWEDWVYKTTYGEFCCSWKCLQVATKSGASTKRRRKIDKEYYEKNKERIKVRQRANTDRIRKELNEIKARSG